MLESHLLRQLGGIADRSDQLRVAFPAERVRHAFEVRIDLSDDEDEAAAIIDLDRIFGDLTQEGHSWRRENLWCRSRGMILGPWAHWLAKHGSDPTKSVCDEIWRATTVLRNAGWRLDWVYFVYQAVWKSSLNLPCNVECRSFRKDGMPDGRGLKSWESFEDWQRGDLAFPPGRHFLYLSDDFRFCSVQAAQAFLSQEGGAADEAPPALATLQHDVAKLKRQSKKKTATETIRDQRNKFSRSHRPHKTWNEIYEAYRAKHPDDVKANPATMRLSFNRNSSDNRQ